MDTPKINDAAGRGSCSSQNQRFDAGDVDYARRLGALLSTARSPRRTGQPWDMTRALVLLLDPERIRDIEATDALDRDGRESVLTVSITRREGEWSLGVHVTVTVDPHRSEFDAWEVEADELCRGEASTALASACELTEGERDFVSGLVEVERAFLARREAAERVERGEARFDG